MQKPGVVIGNALSSIPTDLKCEFVRGGVATPVLVLTDNRNAARDIVTNQQCLTGKPLESPRQLGIIPGKMKFETFNNSIVPNGTNFFQFLRVTGKVYMLFNPNEELIKTDPPAFTFSSDQKTIFDIIARNGQRIAFEEVGKLGGYGTSITIYPLNKDNNFKHHGPKNISSPKSR